MNPPPVDLGTQSRIASKIDSFIEKDPKRAVDLWKKSSMVTLHNECIAHLNMPKDQEISVLDAGCGVGHFCENLLNQGYDLNNLLMTGFDLSPKAIEEAKRNYPTQDWLVASFVDHFPEGQYDYSFCAGPFCYYQGQDHWGLLDFQLNKMRESTKVRGIGYLLYTDKLDWKPFPNYRFVRYNPQQVQERYPDVKVIVNEDRVKQAFGSSFADMDLYYVMWERT
jgi:SAM-dependent methyltransferase